MNSRRPPSSSAMILYLLFLNVITSARGLPDQQICNNSTCGDLQIRYPFRLKGDPSNCGDHNYELTCSSSKTFLQFQSSEYLVKQILYDGNTIQLVDAGLLRNSCSLPLNSFSPNSIIRPEYYRLITRNFVSLVNCSRKIELFNYQLVPCLSKKDSYVYAALGYAVSDLAPSCSFLYMLPASVDSAQIDLFQSYREGFLLTWSSDGLSAFNIMKRCLRDSAWMFADNFRRNNIFSLIPAIFKAEMHFPACLEDYSEISRRVNLYFRLSIAVIVVIEIVQIIIVLALLGRFAFAPSILCIFLAHKFWRNRASTDVVEKFLQAQQSLAPTRYAYTEIIAITRHFKEQLGKGGFGSVYKGELPVGNFVAVKLLGSNAKCNGDEFISEVSTIGRIHHLNVVRLVGYCSEGSKRAVIYEYMQNGSLDKHIFSSDGTPKHCFTWEKLKEIALGVARGIDYLHHGCDMTILHFDIKPQNILLDRSFTPKVSDFGLAKLYPKEHNVVSVSAARGTIGYIAPELVSRNFGAISDKSDVYSFGMLLIEMAAGRRNVNNPNVGSSSQVYYPSLIYDKLKHAKEEMNINYNFKLEQEERRLYLVGLWCIQVRPSDRPSMNQVVQMLEGDPDFLQLPPKPFVYSSSSIDTTIHSRHINNTELPNIDEDE